MRVVVIVIDGGGIGALPDAGEFGDAATCDTIANTARATGGLSLPNLGRWGLGVLDAIQGVPPASSPAAQVARLRERSRGKDTIAGHWEMAGIITTEPFPTYPHGFPPEIVEKLTQITGKAPLGNVAASGTAIIEQLGQKHLATGRPILYTSADSVFQLAAHEDVVPLATLYDWCERMRAMLVAPHGVNRVIGRPFLGNPGGFYRTPNRRDYAIEPPTNLLDELRSAGVGVYAVGKISDIYCGRGIEALARVTDNRDAMDKTFHFLDNVGHGFIFTNLNDFDSKYGHRRDARGFAQALEELDSTVPKLESLLRPGDRAIFTADHGCDPTAPGSDHTREYVPFLNFGPASGRMIGDVDGLDYVGKTVKAALGIA